jgi:hypothetical protein
VRTVAVTHRKKSHNKAFFTRIPHIFGGLRSTTNFAKYANERLSGPRVGRECPLTGMVGEAGGESNAEGSGGNCS